MVCIFSACFSSLGNEKGVTSPQISVTASTELVGSHTAEDSSLYGSSSWCSHGDASYPQYLQFNFGKVVTVSGIATQGDAVGDKWVTKYAVSYGFDEQSWLDYAGGQVQSVIYGTVKMHLTFICCRSFSRWVNLFPTQFKLFQPISTCFNIGQPFSTSFFKKKKVPFQAEIGMSG